VTGHDIIVIGASSGGIEALSQLMAQLPEDLPAAIFVVVHVSADFPSYLDQLLDGAGPLMARTAEDGEAIQHGRVYIAPPDNHLLVQQERVRLVHGPRENRSRPAIDPLLRSAAVTYTSRVVGVVLSGLLDDGTAGLLAVKRCGGVTVVQHPDDAICPDMPRSALTHVEVDYCLPIAELGALLNRLGRQEVKSPPRVPEDVLLEVEAMEHIASDIGREDALGTLTPLICPECSGPLWVLHNDKLCRYRCRIGHAFTPRALLAEQDHALEQALWAAVHSMEERVTILLNLARDERTAGRQRLAKSYADRAAESQSHAQAIRQLLLDKARHRVSN
jgi:two-component system chemotaxis response regulator CheB